MLHSLVLFYFESDTITLVHDSAFMHDSRSSLCSVGVAV